MDQLKTFSPNGRHSLPSRWPIETGYADKHGLPAIERPPQSALAEPVRSEVDAVSLAKPAAPNSEAPMSVTPGNLDNQTNQIGG